ncbi:MAG: 50S ribosomal protein L6 [Acidiferrobacteraceae bacterium]|jgi:large subunit ribosomal protein L6
MSRVAKNPVKLPSGVEVRVEGGVIKVKGPKGELQQRLHATVDLNQEGDEVRFEAKSDDAWAMAGTTRALVGNMVEGVSQGFEKKLAIVGVGYRAAVKGKALDLTLGFSHPVAYPIPDGITIECPTQTEIVVKGSDKQQVGQVAAEIRRYRPPEPYKGKGVRYADERVVMKEAKKK